MEMFDVLDWSERLLSSGVAGGILRLPIFNIKLTIRT